MLPSDFLNLDRHEKAFVIAAIQVKAKKDEDEAKKAKKSKKK